MKGIQVNDEDYESAGRGVRVGLSLKGVEAKELDKASWLDDGSFKLTDKVNFDFRQSAYYHQNIDGRNLHLQLPGELVMAKIAALPGTGFTASLPNQVAGLGGDARRRNRPQREGPQGRRRRSGSA